MTRVSLHARVALAAALLCALVLLFFWPGVAMYDSVAQYQQVVSGSYYDWHPPAMARLWSLFHGIGWTGQAPMFVLQIGLYWLGLGLIAAALAREGKRIAAIAVLALGLWPPFLGWQAAVLKDAQMAAALLAATGIIGWRRLTGQKPRPIDLVAAVLLLVYATLVRANAVFAAAPLAAGLFVPWTWRRWPVRLGLIAAGTLAVLAVSPSINHHLLRADASGVEATQPIFDMAGIAHRAGPDAAPLLPRAVWAQAEALHCSSSVLWDPYSSGERCGFVQDALDGTSPHAIFAGWTGAIRAHPGAYAAHRIAHWNATMRWFVPWHFPLSIPEAGSEPNDLGLGSPAKAAEPFDKFAGWLANGPLGAPILALAAALAVLALARPASSAAHALAVPLALSAAALETSFLLVSISSDWRYHLWSMLAAWLAAILLLTRPLPRRAARIALTLVLLVGASEFAARLLLPAVGDNYEDLVGAPHGA
ncbi:hypothetical protein [Sphingomonas sp. KR3-1]|uniref:hypothetical protein n=1 Tax=Sphingomonas sp. KR3-1 TaxID=3156611 RepID=UPI0032B568E8